MSEFMLHLFGGMVLWCGIGYLVNRAAWRLLADIFNEGSAEEKTTPASVVFWPLVALSFLVYLPLHHLGLTRRD